MEKIVESFIQLLQSFREAPIHFLILSILTLLAYLLYTQQDYIKELMPNPAKESAQFQASLQRDLVVNQALENSLYTLNASNIAIAQFHNGQYDLTRLPFTKISVTYFQGSTGGLTTDQIYSTRPLSTMNAIMLQMWKDKNDPECIATETEAIPDPAYRDRLQEAGTRYVSLCPLTNVLNYPIGYIAVGYEGFPQETDIVTQFQRALTLRIAGYLQEGVIKRN